MAVLKNTIAYLASQPRRTEGISSDHSFLIQRDQTSAGSEPLSLFSTRRIEALENDLATTCLASMMRLISTFAGN